MLASKSTSTTIWRVPDDIRNSPECTKFFADHPYDANVLTTILAADLITAPEKRSTIYVVVHGESDKIIGMGAYPGKDNPPFLSEMPPGCGVLISEALYPLIRDDDVKGVNGAIEPTKEFVSRWRELAQGDATAIPDRSLDIMMAVSRANLRTPRKQIRGQVRDKDAVDVEEVLLLLNDFQEEVGLPVQATDDIMRRLKQRIARSELVIWESDDPIPAPVAIAGWRPPGSEGGFPRVGPVFTPKQFRGCGFATAATYAVTKLAFGMTTAEEVILYAEKENLISTRVYKNLGYETVGQSARYRNL
ncbi:hypothetical protein BJ742DRAFT_774118 [Cladochytrium replicatum]|nr:hypothetical protein BJ742DRAFT_774118 [Cladochytrium replicatum]